LTKIHFFFKHGKLWINRGREYTNLAGDQTFADLLTELAAIITNYLHTNPFHDIFIVVIAQWSLIK